MKGIDAQDRKLLLSLARSAIESKLAGRRIKIPSAVSESLTRETGCFVTLHKKGRLRGCIGTLEPEKPLIRAVADNALNAAFEDPRFSPLQVDELEDIDIEISVLTPPELLDFDGPGDLKKKLKPGIHGVIVSEGWRRATFLPQVWDQLPELDQFMSHLCQKAGMDRDCWKRKDVKIQIYTVVYFSEKEINSNN